MGVAGYNVYQGGVFLKTVTNTTTSDTGLTDATQYCYKVSAYDAAGNDSAQTTSVCATTLLATTQDTTAPTVPAGFTATTVSTSQIDLSWTASTDNVAVAGYKIYRGGTYLKSVTTTSTADTGLSSGLQYCYTVSAYDAVGNESSQSSQSCALSIVFVTTTVDSTGDYVGWYTSIQPEKPISAIMTIIQMHTT